MPRLKARKDSNHNEVQKALEDFGCSVCDVSAFGRGFVDIVVGYEGRNYLFEIKDGAKPPSARKLTEDEEKFHRDWKGRVDVVLNAEQAIDIVRE
jgi:Holliday junction resolvase